MEIDIIVTWPDNCDYPLWRQWLRDNRKDFKEVYIAFMQSNGVDNYTEFVKRALEMDNVTFIPARQRMGYDWRDVAVNDGLNLSRSEWVLFTEQDMLFNQQEYNAFMRAMSKYANGVDVFGFKEGERLHPAWLLARRASIEKTKKNFGIVPNKHDHFYMFYEELQKSGARISELPDLFAYHMAGLSHNLTLMRRGEEVTYKPFAFLDYLKRSLRVSVPLDDHYLNIVGEYILQNE